MALVASQKKEVNGNGGKQVMVVSLLSIAVTFISYRTYKKWIPPKPIQITCKEMENRREKEKDLINKSYLIIDCRRDEEIKKEAILPHDDWVHIKMKDMMKDATSKSYINTLLKYNNGNKIEHLYII